jgi:carbon monoxide dehydrogenase subunit G
VSVIADDRVDLAVARDGIWRVFSDASALARVLPGCESLEASGPNTFGGVLATRLQFLTIRADVTARLLDLEPPDRLRLELEGRPRGLAGGFRADIPIELIENGAGTTVQYQVDLTTTGRLATFGAPILRDSFRRQVATLVTNLERELAAPSGRSATTSPRPTDPADA